MAFIEKENPVVLNIMLTSKGREQLSTGNLTFSYFAIGDSEINYDFIREVNADPNVDPKYVSFDSSILRPKDKNPKIISFIPRNLSGDPYNEISTISPISYDVVNTANSIGFFSGNTFIIDALHVKQPDMMIFMSGATGGTSLSIRKAPTFGASGNEPAINDLLFVKWSIDADTTGHTINENMPTPYLMYQIVDKSGSLAANTLKVTVDRELPNFAAFSPTNVSGALLYYTGLTSPHQTSPDYLSESVLDFFNNYQCTIDAFPFWNMTIVYTEELAGIQAADRKFTQFNSRTYGGFVSYIQNQSPVYKKLGIIHYTNNSPANTYGEEFYLNTPTITIPTIMWHKANTTKLGVSFMAIGDVKILTGATVSLNIEYYDLGDINGNIVGKVFPGLKVFVIEDQELLFAMSYKSNRSWTLPNYLIGGGSGIIPCPTTSTTTTTTTAGPVIPTTTTTSTTSTSTTSTSTTSTSTTSTSTTSTSTTSTSTSTTTTTAAPLYNLSVQIDYLGHSGASDGMGGNFTIDGTTNNIPAGYPILASGNKSVSGGNRVVNTGSVIYYVNGIATGYFTRMSTDGINWTSTTNYTINVMGDIIVYVEIQDTPFI